MSLWRTLYGDFSLTGKSIVRNGALLLYSPKIAKISHLVMLVSHIPYRPVALLWGEYLLRRSLAWTESVGRCLFCGLYPWLSP